jgi:hypothetical protein
MSAVSVAIQDVQVNFQSNLESLNAFARTHFGETNNENQPAGENGIDSFLEWIEGMPAKQRHGEPAPGKIRLDRDIAISDGEIAWSRIDDFLNLHLRFFPNENPLRLVGEHFFFLDEGAMRDQIKRQWHRKRLPILRKKRFSTILYYMIYYPSFWRLEQRGLLPLHAAAVDVAGQGMVFCGLPGSGKSTLSLAALSLPGARLLSDNIIFYDTQAVYSCPEPVLVDDRSVELIGAASTALQPLGSRHVFDRSWCHVGRERLAQRTEPRMFFFVGLGADTAVRSLSTAAARDRFTSANWIAKELRRYLVYRSVLTLSGATPGCLKNGSQTTLGALLSRGQSYELTIGWKDGLGKALELVQSMAAKVT